MALNAPPRPSGERGPGLADLAALLEGELDDSARRRAEYSSDASNYRVPPAAVVFPRSEADVLAVLAHARAHGSSVTARGGGTSVAGNAIGPGIVLDFSRHLNRILAIDPATRTARVQPGVILAELQRAAAVHGLRFGPDPSTQSRCTIGGMIGNNACGPRAVRWGRTSDNVRAVRILDGRGVVRELGTGFEPYPELESVVQRELALLRLEFGRFTRQGSGFALEHLLPENGRDLAKMVVGTEGSCGLILEATIDLVEIPAATVLTVLAYPDAATAADDAVELLPLQPQAIESMDSYLVEVVARAQGRVPELPQGGAWLFVETAGATVEEARERAERVLAVAHPLDARIVADAAQARRLWRIREDGVGLAGRTPEGEPAWPGWEDAAVPPERLGAYLREFEELKQRHGVRGLSYGHYGDGCVHTRLDLPIQDAPARFRAFVEEAAAIVVRHGGSLSGEHGDGRARGELLATMYTAQALALFAEVKAVFDPEGVLNPGIVVRPAPVDVDLRLPGTHPLPAEGLALLHDRGDLGRAVHRCVGVGKCRADNSATGGFMCPSYLATKDEKDSTRGRARVLQELANGALVAGYDAPELAESLDLCLSCRACGSDCPAGVNMAAYKSEALYQKYRGKRRPISHYSFGWLPRWLRLVGPFGPLVNAAGRVPSLRRWALRLAGADPRRAVPALPRRSARSWWRRHEVRRGGRQVVLWLDSFTNGLSPEIATAAVAVLEDAGCEVIVLPRQECCGLTWITTGQLDTARRLLLSSVDALAPHVAAGRPIVGLEPSCTAVLRSDVIELLPEDPRARAVAAATRTLAEFLTDIAWQPPSLDGVSVLAQPHCHQHAVMGFATDEALLRGAGASVQSIAGCCGLAGNFGMEQGHYDVSVAVAENGLLPALREAGEAVFMADGFSCRTQAQQLAGRDGEHLAQLLSARLSARLDRPAP
ncbi:FAD-binding oxidoreductase [Microbacteriaceae bacterium VKM Ac-2855]|nr:FAD-binding oxidoreductase [Microbacteriaceae bacterium VKM Ac-2855]